MIIIYTLCSLWSIRIIGNLLSYIHLWWVKEYRFDRMLIHLKTDQGKRLLILPFRSPPISPKSIGVFSLSLFTLFFLFQTLQLSLLLRFLLLDIAAFPITAFWVFILAIPTIVYHEVLIFLAVRKLRQHKRMQVIGITGSYGKTSVKEFLATILESRYQVLKTEGSKNSPIAIAELILHKLQPDHVVFVVEMAAYKRGEIARMTEMVQPQIGIVTAINEQHQDLFGSLDITKQAKYELIAGLNGVRIAIFNADNPHTLAMASWAANDKAQVWLYTQKSMLKSLQAQRWFEINNVKNTNSAIAFSLKSVGKTMMVTAAVLGAHQAENITAAIAGAIAAGLDFKSAVGATSAIHSFSKTMEAKPGIKGSTFIIDTFSNNPDAARAALNYLETRPGKKILVFQPMIELGSYSEAAHKSVGKLAGKICDEILVTNPNFFTAFVQGVHTVNPKKSVRVVTATEGARRISQSVTKGDTVLFKGKEAESVINALTKYSK